MRVHAVVTEDPSKKPRIYAFAVDINAPSIHPANDNGKEILNALNKPLPRPAATASASSKPAGSAASEAKSQATAAGSASAGTPANPKTKPTSSAQP